MHSRNLCPAKQPSILSVPHPLKPPFRSAIPKSPRPNPTQGDESDPGVERPQGGGRPQLEPGGGLGRREPSSSDHLEAVFVLEMADHVRFKRLLREDERKHSIAHGTRAVVIRGEVSRGTSASFFEPVVSERQIGRGADGARSRMGFVVSATDLLLVLTHLKMTEERT